MTKIRNTKGTLKNLLLLLHNVATDQRNLRLIYLCDPRLLSYVVNDLEVSICQHS